ncbi:VOC family protein [Oceanobacillus chungangensis]|uniref:VOC domain-containing protein n=1 Tax=Oceanobacillus chungangensis TaxID=1229152 RepID=A0A3D8PY78_9BACI|nr:VOC family protein [Oceanobacillus chungangensis]RDW20974.1 hypothetical protein CWR45_03765 [Oceanobacillus chungangensis]
MIAAATLIDRRDRTIRLRGLIVKMSLLERVDSICLKVSDIEKASTWYQDILGFNESFKGDNYRILTVGNSKVPLTIEEGVVRSSHSQVYPIFYSKNIENVYDVLKENCVTVSDLHYDGVNKYFNLFDLDGNKLQVCYWD